MPEYTKPVQQLLGERRVKPNFGLTPEQAAAALEKYGENRLKAKKKLNFFQKFLLQMKDVMVIILLIAAAISFAVAIIEKSGEFIDAIVILAIVVLNGVLGVMQESRAEASLAALEEMASPIAKVLRSGSVQTIPSREVVPGDIVLLEAGDLVPADGRLLESASLRSEESALTGESVPVEKSAEAVVAPNAPLGDRLNMVYSGCSVSYGRGRYVVTATGMNSEMGKIAGLLENAGADTTPLQLKLAQMGKYLGILAIAVCAVIFAVGLLQGMDKLQIFMMSVSLAVAAIPEGLTAVVTVVLAIGVQQMVKKNAIIRRLPAVETLGSATVICSDKTGTLTQNRMTVMKVWPAGGHVIDMSPDLPAAAQQVLRLGSLCNDGRIVRTDDGENHIGDPTETAIVAAAQACGLYKDELDVVFPRLAEIPFDSDRKLMTTVHRVGDKFIAIVKGGFDVLLPLCTSGDSSRAEKVNHAMASEALRVLAVACRELESPPKNPMPDELEWNLTFIGLIGMIDPPREESRHAVELCRKAGIKTVMITGDHVTTASAIARRLGILENDSQALSGQELQKMSDDELQQDVVKYRVYARVTPEDKIRIVEAWQANGDVVAMTGDGVNDAPALMAADIGCAMGITGTDVAKGAADMVLTDDNFSTIVEAVRVGRGIFDNIKKTIMFLLGSNLGEVFTVFVSMLLGWGAPLQAIHLLLVNVVTDSLPALALGVEPVESGIMDRRPVPRDQGVFAGGMGLRIALQGLMVGAITLAAYAVGRFAGISEVLPRSPEIGATMAFLVLAISQLVHASNCRSRQSLFRIGLLTNPSMIKAFLCSLAVVMVICLVPPVEKIFHVVDISMAHWLIVIGLSLLPLVIMEIAKAVENQLAVNK